MTNILVLGAGRSSSSLISYLLANAQTNTWTVTVGDISEHAARERIQQHPAGKAVRFDIHTAETNASLIADADIVISLLPANFHSRVAQRCLEFGKHLFTAS